MDDLESFSKSLQPTPGRPLLGLTVLVVEDSRYACEAMRLLCLRSGARIRRADCLKSARRHLQVYRPSVVIVDLGLPDGSGCDLIAELNAAVPRVEVILGTSGDDGVEHQCIAAGADGFIAKPINSLGAFQHAVVSRLPADKRPAGIRAVADVRVKPDPIAYQDDMAHVAEMLAGDADTKTLDYIAQFTYGVARSAHDDALSAAAHDLAQSSEKGAVVHSHTARLAGMVQDRLAQRVAI